MRIEVTQKCIDRGEPRDYRSCPVAIAAKRAGLKHVWVVRDWIFWGDARQVALPTVVIDWIDRFDSGLDVEPISFDLDVQP